MTISGFFWTLSGIHVQKRARPVLPKKVAVQAPDNGGTTTSLYDFLYQARTRDR